MKRIKHLALTALLVFVSATQSFAYDFEVDGFYYTKLSENTVKLTCNQYDKAIITLHIYGVSYLYSSSMTKYSGDVTIPSSVSDGSKSYQVVAIDDAVFYHCNDMISVKIPDGITSIGNFAFYGCSGLTSITIPNEVTSIGKYAFNYCTGLKSITIPDGVTAIKYGTFYYCGSLNEITIGKGVTSIENWAFHYCKPLTVHISSIENWMKINMGDDLFYVSNFYRIFVNDSELTDLTVPNDITIIGKNTFFGCISLKSITLHKDVTTILQKAFNGCYNVKKITCQGDTPPVCGANALTGISRSGCTLYVPTTSGSSYKNTSPWSEFTNIVGSGTETPDTPKTCAVPTITFDNNTKQLKFESATSGAKYNYTISSEDMATASASESGVAQMKGVYDITAYAYADGMYNSEKATAKLLWVNAVIDSSTDVISANTQRGVIVSAQNGNINICGTVSGETVNVYNTAGSLVKSVKAQDENMVVGGLKANEMYVVKIGGTSVKVAL